MPRTQNMRLKSPLAMSFCVIQRANGATLWSVMGTVQSTSAAFKQLVTSKGLHRFNGFGHSTDAPLSSPAQRPPPLPLGPTQRVEQLNQ